MKKKQIKNKKSNGLLNYALILTLLCAFIFPANKIYAEGTSADLSLVTSRSDLYPGKTFNISLYINPNMKIDISTFNVEIEYDEKIIEVIKAGGAPKITPSTKIPKDFTISPPSVSSGVIGIAGFTMSKPIAISGNTPLFTLFFKVKDNAVVGTKQSLSISSYTSFTFNIPGSDPDKVILNYPSPKIVNIGPKQSTVASLESLFPSQGTLTPNFSSDTLNYTLEVPDSVNSVEFTAKPKFQAATYKITGGTSLNYGANTVTIKVTAEDKDFNQTYSIKVNRAKIPAVISEESSTSEEISSSEIIESSSESELEEVTPTNEAPVSVISEDPTDSGPWKTIAIVFVVLFVLSSGVVVWLSIDKVRNRDKMIKVKRV